MGNSKFQKLLQGMVYATMGMMLPTLCFLAGFDTSLFTKSTAYLILFCFIGKIIDNIRRGEEYFLLDICYFNVSILLYNEFVGPVKLLFALGYCLSNTALVAIFMYSFRYLFTHVASWLNFMLHLLPMTYYLSKEVELGLDLSDITASQYILYTPCFIVAYLSIYIPVTYFWTYPVWSNNPNKSNLYLLTMEARINRFLAKRLNENQMMTVVTIEFCVTVLSNTVLFIILSHNRLFLIGFVVCCAYLAHLNASFVLLRGRKKAA